MINYFFEVYKYFKWASSMFSCPSFYQYFNSVLYSYVFGEEFRYYHLVNIIIAVVALVVLYYVVSLVYKLVQAVINVVFGIKNMIVIIYKFIRGIFRFLFGSKKNIFSGRNSTTTSKDGDGNGNENKNESQNSAKKLDPVRENKPAAQYNVSSSPTVVSSPSKIAPNYQEQQQQSTVALSYPSTTHHQYGASLSSANAGGIYNHNNDATSGFIHNRSSFPIPVGNQFQQQPPIMTAQQQHQYFYLQQQQATANFVLPISSANAHNYDSEDDNDGEWNEEDYKEQMKAIKLSTTAREKPTTTVSATVAAIATKPKKTATPRETKIATIASSSTKKRSRMFENNAYLGNKNNTTDLSSPRLSKKQRREVAHARAKEWAKGLKKPAPRK